MFHIASVFNECVFAGKNCSISGGKRIFENCIIFHNEPYHVQSI